MCSLTPNIRTYYKMFYHFLGSLVLRMSAIVKEEISKLKQCCFSPFCSGARRQHEHLSITPAALSAYSVLKSFYPVSSQEPALQCLRKQDAHYVTERAHKSKAGDIYGGVTLTDNSNMSFLSS